MEDGRPRPSKAQHAPWKTDVLVRKICVGADALVRDFCVEDGASSPVGGPCGGGRLVRPCRAQLGSTLRAAQEDSHDTVKSRRRCNHIDMACHMYVLVI